MTKTRLESSEIIITHEREERLDLAIIEDQIERLENDIKNCQNSIIGYTNRIKDLKGYKEEIKDETKIIHR